MNPNKYYQAIQNIIYCSTLNRMSFFWFCLPWVVVLKMLLYQLVCVDWNLVWLKICVLHIYMCVSNSK